MVFPWNFSTTPPWLSKQLTTRDGWRSQENDPKKEELNGRRVYALRAWFKRCPDCFSCGLINTSAKWQNEQVAIKQMWCPTAWSAEIAHCASILVSTKISVKVNILKSPKPKMVWKLLLKLHDDELEYHSWLNYEANHPLNLVWFRTRCSKLKNGGSPCDGQQLRWGKEVSKFVTTSPTMWAGWECNFFNCPNHKQDVCLLNPDMDDGGTTEALEQSES